MFETLASCANFGGWHAFAIVGVAFAIAWAVVTFIKN